MSSHRISIEDAAKIFHEWERSYRSATNDWNQLEPWAETTEENRETGRAFVRELLASPYLTARQQHEIWRSFKQDRGWTYGPEYSREKKTNPCMVEWGSMPVHKQVEAEIMIAMVRIMRPIIDTSEDGAGDEPEMEPQRRAAVSAKAVWIHTANIFAV